jgi:hypothetical protein
MASVPAIIVHFGCMDPEILENIEKGKRKYNVCVTTVPIESTSAPGGHRCISETHSKRYAACERPKAIHENKKGNTVVYCVGSIKYRSFCGCVAKNSSPIMYYT